MSPEEARIKRAHAGAALCRAAIAEVLERRQTKRNSAAVPLSRSDQIHQRARLRAQEERQAARWGATA